MLYSYAVLFFDECEILPFKCKCSEILLEFKVLHSQGINSSDCIIFLLSLIPGLVKVFLKMRAFVVSAGTVVY